MSQAEKAEAGFDFQLRWDEKTAARWLGLSVEFLQQDRARDEGPRIPYLKLGRAVRYDPKDVQAYAERCKVAARA